MSAFHYDSVFLVGHCQSDNYINGMKVELLSQTLLEFKIFFTNEPQSKSSWKEKRKNHSVLMLAYLFGF